MIRLTSNPTFDRQVTVNLRGMEAPAQVRFTFRAPDAKRVRSLAVLSRRMEAGWFVRVWELLKLCLRLRKLATGIDLLDQMIVSWDDGDSGFELPYSKQALLLLLAKEPGLIVRISLAFFDGWQEERLKN